MLELPDTKPQRDKLKSLNGKQTDYRDTGDSRVRGLALRVSPSGQKSWIITARRPGHKNPTRITIGDYRELGLSEARDKAVTAKSGLKAGIDIVANRKQKRDDAIVNVENTFSAWVSEYLDRYSAINHSSKNHKEIRRVFNKEFRIWDKRPIAEITPDEIDRELNVINNRKGNNKSVAGNRYFAYLRHFFTWATSRCPTIHVHPMAGLERPKKYELPRDNIASLDDLTSLWLALPETGEFQGIIRTLILTGARRGEVAGMKWNEVDTNQAVWNLPAARIKEGRKGKKKSIPLSPTALSIINARPKLKECPFVFGTVNGNLFDDWDKRWKKLFVEDEMVNVNYFTRHDIRRTLSTRMNDDLNAWLAVKRAGVFVRSEVVEEILGHAAGGHKKGIAATYNGATYDDERRLALDAWADFLNEKITADAPDNVVPLISA